jgi:hypothetical protein
MTIRYAYKDLLFRLLVENDLLLYRILDIDGNIKSPNVAGIMFDIRRWIRDNQQAATVTW